jgi:hypothetical protein
VRAAPSPASAVATAWTSPSVTATPGPAGARRYPLAVDAPADLTGLLPGGAAGLGAQLDGWAAALDAWAARPGAVRLESREARPWS